MQFQIQRYKYSPQSVQLHWEENDYRLHLKYVKSRGFKNNHMNVVDMYIPDFSNCIYEYPKTDSYHFFIIFCIIISAFSVSVFACT